MIKRMIISDIDGTLIGNDRKLPPQLEQLAALIGEREVSFTIASGRIQSRIAPLVQLLGITLPVIGCNGASAKQGNRYLWNKLIPPHCLREAAEFADSVGMSLVLTDGETEYAYRRTPWIADLMDNHGRYDGVRPIVGSDWDKLSVQKVLIDDSAKSGQLDRVIAMLANWQKEVALVRYQGDTLDVMPAGCSKGAAVRLLSQQLGIPLESIVAVGDHQNDIEMIKAAGIGGAVANADDALKQVADYVCEYPLCRGVIEVVERFGV